MDEVGFMVSEIKPDGTFRVVEIGGWNPMVVSSQRFKLFTRQGREIPVILRFSTSTFGLVGTGRAEPCQLISDYRL